MSGEKMGKVMHMGGRSLPPAPICKQNVLRPWLMRITTLKEAVTCSNCLKIMEEESLAWRIR